MPAGIPAAKAMLRTVEENGGNSPRPGIASRSPRTPFMKLAHSLLATFALAATAATTHAGLVTIGPQPDGFAGNPTSEFNRLLSYLDSGDLAPNGAFIKYNPGFNQIAGSGDLLTPFDDSLTVPGVNISGANLSFLATTPLYFLVKAGTQQSIFFYDGIGDVSLLDPIVNGRGIPRNYSHVTFFGIDVPPPPPPPIPPPIPPDHGPRVPDGGTTLPLLSLGILGLWAMRRATRKP